VDSRLRGNDNLATSRLRLYVFMVDGSQALIDFVFA
jgi:hypothetical protein